ncbi:helix-turn-helix domain-containing protein [Aquirufa sp. HETE-83D]|uniref:Helix-turn-helix domain-containing protein n=1 Tax=Aquirufa esocilacus TaxID=3096513 RepID=A0ABW6DJA6_9BACT
MIDLMDFSQASIICGLLTVYVLLFKKNALRSFSDYILSSFIFCQIYAAILYLLIYTGKIVFVAFLYRTAAPFTFLIPPLGYLYVRTVLFNEQKFKRIDLLHLLPFFFFLINYLPFYFSPNDFKLDIISKTIQAKTFAVEKQLGLFPETIFYVFRPIQSVFYLIFQWVLIFEYKKANPIKMIENQIKLVIQWLRVFTFANALIIIGYVITIPIYFLLKEKFDTKVVHIIPEIILGVGFFSICCYLLIYPQALNGLPFVKYKEIHSSLLENEMDKIPFIYQDYSNEIKLIEKYFIESQAYLQPNLSINQVAVETKIPSRELSYIINNHYKKRFNDYLNEMRLRHFLSKVDSKTLDNFTIEAIALESGFSYKSSFYRAFNRFYSCTPSVYFENSLLK